MITIISFPLFSFLLPPLLGSPCRAALSFVIKKKKKRKEEEEAKRRVFQDETLLSNNSQLPEMLIVLFTLVERERDSILPSLRRRFVQPNYHVIII